MRVEDFYAVPTIIPCLSSSWLLSLSTHITPILHTNWYFHRYFRRDSFLLPSSPASFSVYLSASACRPEHTSDRRDSSSSKLSFPPHTQPANTYSTHNPTYDHLPLRSTVREHIPHTTTQQPYSLKALFPINIPLTSLSFLPPFLFSICSSANKLQYRPTTSSVFNQSYTVRLDKLRVDLPNPQLIPNSHSAFVDGHCCQ
jgi:hypothetical protein